MFKKLAQELLDIKAKVEFLKAKELELAEKLKMVCEGQTKSSSGIIMKWYIVDKQFYSENTAEYGFGDFPVWIDWIKCVVEADTKLKAMHKVRKLYPGSLFGRCRGLEIYEEKEAKKWYTINKSADHRLSLEKQKIHNDIVMELYKEIKE